jgi:hypothetical protein
MAPATPITLRPHDPQTGREIERDEVRKGYEFERGQFVTFTATELNALDVESSRAIDLTTFRAAGRCRPDLLQCRVLRVPGRRRRGRAIPGDQRGNGRSGNGRPWSS